MPSWSGSIVTSASSSTWSAVGMGPITASQQSFIWHTRSMSASQERWWDSPSCVTFMAPPILPADFVRAPLVPRFLPRCRGPMRLVARHLSYVLCPPLVAPVVCGCCRGAPCGYCHPSRRWAPLPPCCLVTWALVAPRLSSRLGVRRFAVSSPANSRPSLVRPPRGRGNPLRVNRSQPALRRRGRW